MLNDVSPVPPPGWTPPPWLADVGWHPRELAWLASALHDRVQRLQVENRQFRGFLPPDPEQEPQQMTLPLEFRVQNPVHRERFLHEGATLRAVPARLPNPAGVDIEGIALVDAAGNPRVLADLTTAYRLYDTLTEILGLGDEPDEQGE